MYGVINAVVCAPVMIGFAAIIFRHKAFHEDPAVYADLVKLVIFSSVVHQVVFTATSSLPFAIGQVQDAGLIFLSQIACQIADAMADEPRSDMLRHGDGTGRALPNLACDAATYGGGLQCCHHQVAVALEPTPPRGLHARPCLSPA